MPKHRCTIIGALKLRHLHGTDRYNTRSTEDLYSSERAAGSQVEEPWSSKIAPATCIYITEPHSGISLTVPMSSPLYDATVTFHTLVKHTTATQCNAYFSMYNLRLFWDLSWTAQPKRSVRVRCRQFLLQYSFSGIPSANSLLWMEEIKLTWKSSGLEPFWSLPVCGLLEALEPAEELYSGMASLCANWLPSGY